MKVNVVSPFAEATPSQILDFLSRSDALLTILPGISDNHPTVEEVQSCIKRNSFVFMEIKDDGRNAIKKHVWPSIVSKKEISRMPKQIFSENPRSSDVRGLLDIMGERTKTFSFDGASVSISFIICGEINGFNPDGNLKFGYPFSHTNLVVPCHTIMSHWNWLNPKLENLSIEGKLIYVTNNDRNSQKITSSLRIYNNGRRSETRRSAPGLFWAQTEI